MNNKIFLCVLLAVAVALSGCTVQQQAPKDVDSGGAGQPELQDSTGLQGQGQPAGSEECGSMDNMQLLVSSGERTEEENNAIACFNNKMLDCFAGNLELTGQGGRTVSVEGKEGEYCILSFSDAVETKTCKIPQGFIEGAGTLAAAEGKPENLLITVAFGMVAGNLQNTVTGETITIECE